MDKIMSTRIKIDDIEQKFDTATIEIHVAGDVVGLTLDGVSKYYRKTEYNDDCCYFYSTDEISEEEYRVRKTWRLIVEISSNHD